MRRWAIPLLVLVAHAAHAGGAILLVPEDDQARQLAPRLETIFRAAHLQLKIASVGSAAQGCARLTAAPQRASCFRETVKSAGVEAVAVLSAALLEDRLAVSLQLLSAGDGRLLREEVWRGSAAQFETLAAEPIARVVAALRRRVAAKPAEVSGKASAARLEEATEGEKPPPAPPLVEPPADDSSHLRATPLRVTGVGSGQVTNHQEPPGVVEPRPEPEGFAAPAPSPPLDAPHLEAPRLVPAPVEPNPQVTAAPLAPSRTAAWTATGATIVLAATAIAFGALGLWDKSRVEAGTGVSPFSRSQAVMLAQQSNTELSVGAGTLTGAAATAVLCAWLWAHP